MNRRACSCRHCKTPTVQPEAELAHPPVQLPASPRLFRVHHNGRIQDCTLHPDGRMTMRVGEQVLTSMLTFDEMCAMNWATAHIEWDPAPLVEESELPAEPTPVMQPALL